MKKTTNLTILLLLSFCLITTLQAQEPGAIIEQGSPHEENINLAIEGGYLKIGDLEEIHLSIDKNSIQTLGKDFEYYPYFLHLNKFGGEVGINLGNSLPTSTLDVNGSVNIRQNLDIADDVTIDGDIVITNLAQTSGTAICLDSNGKVVAYEPQFTLLSGLNTGGSTVSPFAWDPVGPAKTFTKQYDHTIIDAQLNESVYWSGSANTVRFRVELMNQTISNVVGGQSSNPVTWEHVTSHSIYRNLPAGTYTAQVFARSIGGNTVQVSLRSDVGGGGMWIEEKL